MARVMKPSISLSLIKLFPSPLFLSLTLWSLWCATTAKPIDCQQICTFYGLTFEGTNCETECLGRVMMPPTDHVLGKRKERDYSKSDSFQHDYKMQKSSNVFEEDVIKTLTDESADQRPQNSEKKLLKTESHGHYAVDVGIEITNDGEYILKIKRTVIPSSADEDKLKTAKQMAQNAAMFSFYGEMLQDIGHKLHAQSRASLRSIFDVPEPYSYSEPNS